MLSSSNYRKFIFKFLDNISSHIDSLSEEDRVQLRLITIKAKMGGVMDMEEEGWIVNKDKEAGKRKQYLPKILNHPEWFEENTNV